jgi:hypothetical protein
MNAHPEHHTDLPIPMEVNQVDNTNFWTAPSFVIEYTPEGTMKQLYTDFFYSEDISKAIAFGIVEEENFDDTKVLMIISPPDKYGRFWSYERSTTSGGGSSGTFHGSEISIQPDTIHFYQREKEYILINLDSPTIKDTITNHPQMVRISNSLFSCSYRQHESDEEDTTILFKFDKNRLVGIYKPVEIQKKITPDLTVVGTTTAPFLNDDSSDRPATPALIVKNSFYQCTISPSFGGSVVDKSIKLFAEPTPAQLGITFDLPRSMDSGFVVGGINNEDTILSLTHINGNSMEELTHILQAHSDHPLRRTHGAMLESGQTLASHMLEANEIVQLHGLTHQDMALALQYVHELFEQGYLGNEGTCTFGGVPLLVKSTHFRGGWRSPFIAKKDIPNAIDSYKEITIINATTGHGVKACNTTIDSIKDYGIYYGIEISTGTRYRVNPEDIIQTFELDRKKLPNG